MKSSFAFLASALIGTSAMTVGAAPARANDMHGPYVQSAPVYRNVPVYAHSVYPVRHGYDERRWREHRWQEREWRRQQWREARWREARWREREMRRQYWRERHGYAYGY